MRHPPCHGGFNFSNLNKEKNPSMSKPTKFIVLVLVLALAIPAFAAKPEYVDGAYYVVFKDKASKADKDMLKASGAEVRGEFAEVNAVEVHSKNPHALAAIAMNGKVDYVEAVPMRYALDLAGAQAVPSLS